MKSGLFKRILAMAMMTVLLAGDVLPTFAETVSGGDAVVVEGEDTVNNDEQAEGTEDIVNPNPDVTEGDGEETSEELTDETTSVSDGDAEVVEIEEEETPLDASMLTTLEPVTVDGITITVSGPKTAFAEGTTVSAVAVEPTEVVIAAAEENEQAVVKKYKAFDINLVLDGEFVQPLNGEEITVNFEGDMLIPDTDNNEDVAVYHVDEDDNLTRMDAAVAEVENEDAQSVETVEMTTTHFSTYIVVITGGDSEYTITYKHYVDGVQFYKPSTEIVKPNTIKTYTDFAKAGKTAGGDDYAVSGIKVVLKDGTVVKPNSQGEYKINGNATIEISYTPEKRGVTYNNDVIFYDYSVNQTVEVSGKHTEQESTDLKLENGKKITFWYGGKEYKKYEVKYQKGNDWFAGFVKGGSRFSFTDHTTIERVTYDGKYYDSMQYKSGWEDKGKPKGLCAIAYREVEKEGTYQKKVSINDAMTDANASYYLAMGRADDRPGSKALQITGTYGGNANAFNGGSGEKAIVQGIVKELSQDKKNVIWGKNSAGQQIVEPGYFTMTEVPGKTIYNEGFELTFDQTGNKYQLYSVKNNTGKGVAETLSRCTKEYDYDSHHYKVGEVSGEFFPLDGMPSAEVIESYCGKEHNWYYGMRYDFTFKIGDYIGDLNYTFEGDDDLWVFIDGTLVLDLGGIHSTYPTRYYTNSANAKISNTVDLWETYFGISKADRQKENWWETFSDKYNPDKEYQVTVLYMERGAYASSCYMEFTLPNVESTLITQEYGSLKFTKTDSTNDKAVAGAGFTLYEDPECTKEIKGEVFSDAKGEVVLSKLVAGNYYLKETTAPEGYVKSNNVWTVSVVETTVNNVTTVSTKLIDAEGKEVTKIANDPEVKTINIEFKKVYRFDHSKVLEGAEFTLKKNDINGAIVANAVSGKDGYFEFIDLEEGIYFMEETKAPKGYRTPAEGVGLTITVSEENGELVYKVSSNNSAQLYYMKSGNDNLVKNVKGTSVTVTKEWTDKEGNAIEAPVDEIKVELRRKGTTWDERVQYITLKKADDWTMTLENLDYECDQGVWNYYIVESIAIDGYTPIYSDAVIDTSVEGAYSVKLTVINEQQLGALKIVKTVDKVDAVHGDATFTFKITCPDNSVLYRTMIFNTAGKQETTIEKLPAGSYIVEELDALRYECKSDKVQEKVVIAGADEPTVYEYSNEKVFEKYYSHTDTVINVVTFERNEDGTIKDSTITQQTVTVND